MKSLHHFSLRQPHLPFSDRHFKSLILLLLTAIIMGGVREAYGQSLPVLQGIQAGVNYNVIVKENASDPTRSDVYLQDPTTAQETFYITLLDVYRGHYHNAEFHNGSLYIIHRTGGDSGYETNPNWMDDLWRYNPQEPGVKLFSVRGLDFRVSDDENFIAITAYDETTFKPSVTFTDRSGAVLNVTDGSQFGDNPNFSPAKWGGSSFWLESGAGPTIQQFIKIDTADFQPTVFDVSMFPITVGEYDLNPAKETIAFSDYPVFFDADSVEEFEASGTPITLSVYDLNTQAVQPIATSTVKAFAPRWLDENTLEYNDPNGETRVTQSIP
jgi:hypothetical protein